MPSHNAPPQATLLTRLTLDYSPDEDRMKLSGLTQNGALVVAWLSLRLLGRLVPHLLNRYEVIAASMQSSIPSLQLSNSQEVSGSAAKPVLPENDTPSFLVGAADVTQAANAIVMTLRGPGDSVQFAIPKLKMAHWLSGLKNLYQVAGWPMNVWQGVDQILLSSETGGGSVTLH